MKLEKLIKLKEILDYSHYSIDFNKCEIVNNNTGEYIGYIQKDGRSKTGLKIVGLWFEKKRYMYSVAEIIMIELGYITEKNCNSVIVENISKNARNTHFSNLRVVTRSQLCKLEHIKKIISVKPLMNHWQKPLDDEKINDIMQLKIIGFRATEISNITDINRNTVVKYYYRKKAI
jgi:hypothetical protein